MWHFELCQFRIRKQARHSSVAISIHHPIIPTPEYIASVQLSVLSLATRHQTSSDIMTGKSGLQDSASNPTFETAPPSYDDSFHTPWQGMSTGHSNLPFTPRPALDPGQHALYSTAIPDNVEQPTYQERLVSGIEKTIKTIGNVTRGDVVTHDPRLHDRKLWHKQLLWPSFNIQDPSQLQRSRRSSSRRQRSPQRSRSCVLVSHV
jgi:hypothetical protein